jgi:predicted DNA-binding transcriptional regulator YafY
MDRTERFYRIEVLIRDRASVSFADLQSDLEVSRATLKRDLEYLRSRMDVPIVYDRDSNGYRFEAQAPGASTRKGRGGRELPGVWFSEREIHALLTMQQLIKGLDGAGILARHMAPLQDKLQTMLGTSEVEVRELMKRVRIAQPTRRPVGLQCFERVGAALLGRQRLSIVYYTRSKRSESTRVVSPQRLVHYRNTWYLDAWCHAQDGLRRFALDAVRSADLLDQRAKDVAMKTVEAELDAGYGIYGGKALRSASLLFGPDAAQWVRHELWHAGQQQELLPDGSLRLKLPYSDDTELVMDLMRHGPDVCVEGPPELRRRVAERLAAAAAQYGSGMGAGAGAGAVASAGAATVSGAGPATTSSSAGAAPGSELEL